MFRALLAIATALAIVIATGFLRLVERGARAAEQAAQAGDGLRSVLRDHHDLRTVLMSAQINADLVARQVGAPAVANLREDLGEIRDQIEGVKARALEELAALEEPRPVEIHAAATEVVASLRSRFPGVDLSVEAAPTLVAQVAGGVPALRRILGNLLVNACEGDGQRRARHVELRAHGDATGGHIEIVDAGPGLPAEVLGRPPG